MGHDSEIYFGNNILAESTPFEGESDDEPEEWQIVITFHSYGDDSADASRTRAFAVAAIIAPEAIWSSLEAAWVNRNCHFPFHATDCDSDGGIYKERDHKHNKRLYKDCITLLAESGAFGFAYVIDLAGREEFFPDTEPELHYHWCYQRLIYRMAEFFGSRGISKIKFNFDNRVDIVANASAAYSLMVADDEFPYRHVLEERVEFLCSTKYPRIQVGDIYTREVMKHLDNMVGPVKREERKSFTALRETGRFDAQFFMREAWEDKRRKFDEIQQKAGFTFKEYEDWLKLKKRIHNTSNMFEFLAWLNVCDAKRKADGK